MKQKRFILAFLLWQMSIHFADAQNNAASFTLQQMDFAPEVNLVAIGEEHFREGNHKPQLALLDTCFNQGFHTLVLERGFGEAWLMEQIIYGEAAIEAQLDIYGKEYRIYLDGLIKLIKQQPNKIRIVGIDVERSPWITLAAIRQLLINHKEIPEQLPSLKAFAEFSNHLGKKSDRSKIEPVLDSVFAEASQKTALITEWLGMDSATFFSILRSWNDAQEIGQSIYTQEGFINEERERYLESNYIKTIGKEKAVGIFGCMHVYRIPLRKTGKQPDYSSFVSRLISNHQLNVVSIVPYYTGKSIKGEGKKNFLFHYFDQGLIDEYSGWLKKGDFRFYTFGELCAWKYEYFADLVILCRF